MRATHSSPTSSRSSHFIRYPWIASYSRARGYPQIIPLLTSAAIVGVTAFDPEHGSAESSEQPFPASEDNDLHSLGGTCHDVEHAFNAIVIREDKRVIHDHRCRSPLVEQ